MPEQYFRPRKWGEYQAVKKRGADYIRNKTELLNSPKYLNLTLNQRAILHGLWLLFGDTARPLPLNSGFIGARLGADCRATGVALKALIACNYLEICAETDGLVQQAPPKGEGEGEREGEKKERKGGAGAQKPELVFSGSVIRLTKADFDRWAKAYPKIADMQAELQACDDYLAENPSDDGKWFFRVSSWLKRANADAASDADGYDWKKDPAYAGAI